MRSKDAFAAAVVRRGSFRGDGTLEAWLWSIVLNTARDQRRSRGRRERLERALPEGRAADPGDEATELRARLAALPERQRLVVFLRYYADLDYRTIGEVLGIETGTVSATLSAAHAALRRELEVAR